MNIGGIYGLIAILCFSLMSNAQSIHTRDMASGTLPIISVETEGNRPIVDKINYVPGKLSLEIPSDAKWDFPGESFYDEEIGIRGRGNFSWLNTDKKAYKIKFERKTSVLGMPSNKHYALIGYDLYYPTHWLAPLVGLELGRLIDPLWSPRSYPVDFILNGEFRGIYPLVESIKTAKDRLNITTQPDECEDDEIIPFGWLIELDNQNDDCQIVIPANNSIGKLRVTYKEPEVLSDKQKQWLTNEFTRLNNLIERPDEYPDDRWENYFDLHSIARYMVVREVLHDVDGYSGSQYFYKDINSEVWVAGPFWDLEIWPVKKCDWIINDGKWSLLNWIPFMMKSAKLRDAFIEEWDKFYNGKFKNIFTYIDSLALLEEADLANTNRWPKEGSGLDEKVRMCREMLSCNAEWIENNKYWVLEAPESSTFSPSVNDSKVSVCWDSNTISLKSDDIIDYIDFSNIDGRILFRVCPFSTSYTADLQIDRGVYILSVKLRDKEGTITKKYLKK